PLTTLPSDDRSDLGIFYPIMGHMCHMPVVEVDVGTGQVSFLDYVAVHDCGTLVNPMTLAGHVRGGTAQGIGTALYEQYYYDADGQLLTANYADYLMPTLHELPENVRVGHVETPSPYTEYGIKGGGEGGRMGAPPAICLAIEDALHPLGVKVDALPAAHVDPRSAGRGGLSVPSLSGWLGNYDFQWARSPAKGVPFDLTQSCAAPRKNMKLARKRAVSVHFVDMAWSPTRSTCLR